MDLLNYKSPRSVHMIMRSLTNKGYLRHDDYGIKSRKVSRYN